jgi:5-hydroxyisourate hydrolase
MVGYLTTHVLDTAQGIPASQVAIQIWKLETEGRHVLLKTTCTGENGRTEEPLLGGEAFAVGTYELIFQVGAYFASQQIPVADPPFLNDVPIRFSIADQDAHYHIPLLVSPWAYSTYRGS